MLKQQPLWLVLINQLPNNLQEIGDEEEDDDDDDEEDEKNI